jgi:hypothetical protein
MIRRSSGVNCPGLAEDRVSDRDLADVVERTGDSKQFAALLVEPEAFGKQ